MSLTKVMYYTLQYQYYIIGMYVHFCFVGYKDGTMTVFSVERHMQFGAISYNDLLKSHKPRTKFEDICT